MTAAVYQTSPIKRTRSTKAEIEARREALLGIIGAGRPMTVRQVFYQATVRGLVEKAESGELVEWHAPRPDEEGWNPDLADAPAEQCLMAANRNLVDAALAELEHEIALHEAERAETARQDKFQRVREDAERRRQRGDHEGAAFLEQWIARQTAKEGLARRTKDDARHAQESIPGEAVS